VTAEGVGDDLLELLPAQGPEIIEHALAAQPAH